MSIKIVEFSEIENTFGDRLHFFRPPSFGNAPATFGIHWFMITKNNETLIDRVLVELTFRHNTGLIDIEAALRTFVHTLNEITPDLQDLILDNFIQKDIKQYGLVGRRLARKNLQSALTPAMEKIFNNIGNVLYINQSGIKPFIELSLSDIGSALSWHSTHFSRSPYYDQLENILDPAILVRAPSDYIKMYFLPCVSVGHLRYILEV